MNAASVMKVVGTIAFILLLLEIFEAYFVSGASMSLPGMVLERSAVPLVVALLVTGALGLLAGISAVLWRLPREQSRQSEVQSPTAASPEKTAHSATSAFWSYIGRLGGALWMTIAAIVIFLVPVASQDATPMRTGLALCAGAGALASAFAAIRAMQSGGLVELATWSGGLGGRGAGFQLSAVAGMLLVTIVLAAVAATTITRAPAQRTGEAPVDRPPPAAAGSGGH